MKILSATPVRVGTDEPARRRARHLCLSPPGAEVVMKHGTQNSPGRSATKEDVQALAASVTKAQAAASDRGSALRMPDCVPDPTAAVTPHGARLPAIGMLRLAATLLAATGRMSSTDTRNRTIGGAPIARIEDYGLRPRFAGLRPRFAGVTALSRDSGAIPGTRRWNGAGGDAVDGFAAPGVTAMINGCSATDTDAPHAVQRLDRADRALRLPAAGVRA